MRRLAIALLLLPLSAFAADPPGPAFPPEIPYATLPNWRADALVEALPPLIASCEANARAGAPQRGLAALPAETWAAACAELVDLSARLRRLPPRQRNNAVRSTIEAQFTAHAMGEGLLTGYFEPVLHGRRAPDERFRTPLHAAPPDLPAAGAPTRAAIEAGALFGRNLELAWLAEPWEAFFLQIQGSGRILLDDGGVLRLGYASQNGHPYVAVGRLLIASGAIAREAMSMQAILGWMRQEGPEAASALMRANPSYVFFRVVEGLRPSQGPLGAQGVPLTPRRSVAVDPDFIPLGAPVYIATRDGAQRRLTVAQDIGGAIRGPARADLFHGWEEGAAEAAGRQRDTALIFVLLPRRAAVIAPHHVPPDLSATRLRVPGAGITPVRQAARRDPRRVRAEE
ncbi:murein transglycosylase A [Plastoroseomonas arctica]|uniref:peptidoglycan lytic exotransglycosylase n=1 Tax=Plastoroseomonas arctica TaxID=1509237 RepID=A0AAF1K1L3_9PROT|nr:MltA domain-containing protein [Plastoroseomonas arctica]MBR0655248.1 murein transglycosylase [Plastoroseomonas arctica]